MKYSNAMLGAFALSIMKVVAFPRLMFDIAENIAPRDALSIEEVTAAIRKNLLEKRVQGVAPGFSAQDQYISTSGSNQFVPPSPADLRGPCPGLNALANHNYLPHNGLATITQFVEATNTVYGMGLDLGGFLAVYGAVMDGDLTSWSIGGPPPSSLLALVGLLGQPQGISGSHNKYESDVSPTRGDLYQYGNDYKLVISQFQELFSTQPDAATANYTIPVLEAFRDQRFKQQIASNPYFFNGPFTGVAVQPAAYSFIYRFMANHTAEYPEGILNQDVLKSFFAITGDSGSFQNQHGWERIPDNWYRRAIGDEYTIPYFSSDTTGAAIQYPEFFDVGGNTGEVNTFTGVDLNNLTGGVYNAQTLTQGNNAICFAFQAAQQAAPDILKGLFADTATAVGQLNTEFTTVFAELGCPQLQQIDASQFSQYPGVTKLNSNGQY